MLNGFSVRLRVKQNGNVWTLSSFFYYIFLAFFWVCVICAWLGFFTFAKLICLEFLVVFFSFKLKI